MGGGHRQEVAEGRDVARAFVLPGAAQEYGRLPDPVLRERPVGLGDEGFVAFADAGQGQVVGERGSGEPDGAGAAVGTVAGQRDRVPDEGAVVVAVFTHAQARVAEPVEEVGVAVGEGGRGADGALQGLPGGLREAAAGGFLGLAGDRPAARGAVERGHLGEAPAGFETAGGGVHGGDVAAYAGVAAVLAGEGRRDVDVVVRVPYRDPPAGLFVAVFGDARGVHHGGGDLAPFRVRQDAIVSVITDRDVPHVLVRLRAAQRFHGRVQEQRQIGERHAVRCPGRAGQGRSGSQPPTRWGSTCSSRSPGPKRYSRRSIVVEPPSAFFGITTWGASPASPGASPHPPGPPPPTPLPPRWRPTPGRRPRTGRWRSANGAL